MAVPEGVIHNERLAERAAQLDVDLLAIQEVDFFQPRSQLVDQCAVIAAATGATHISRAFAIVGTPGEQWKKYEEREESLKAGGAGVADSDYTSARYYGNGIISRIPIVEEFRLELGRSKIGAPLAIPQTPPDQSRPKIKLIYIHDEPRVAHAVHLANGITVINTHLSFVPGMNIYQLKKIRKWADSLPGEKILVGDLNLPGTLPERILKWRSAASQFTYPSWGARVQFDHILLSPSAQRRIESSERIDFIAAKSMVSDHLPVGVALSTGTV